MVKVRPRPLPSVPDTPGANSRSGKSCGFFSVLAVLEDGQMIEVATVGREGVIGTAASVMQSAACNAVHTVERRSSRR